MSSEDSSSSDEDTELNERLKAAASVQLISCMNSSEKSEKQLKDNKEGTSVAVPINKLKSIREKVYGEPVAEDNALNTTPEFRLHVSKKLGKYIDGNIELFQHKSKSQRIEFDEAGGVKLLSNSIRFLKDSNDVISPNKKRKPVRKASETSSSDEEMDKLNSVAVSGMEILQNGQGAFKPKTAHKNT